MSVETENNMLGALLNDNSLIQQYPFDIDDFVDLSHRKIYETMWSLAEKDGPVDAITVAEAIDDEGSFFGRLVQMANETTAVSNASSYHVMLRENGTVRRARDIAEQLKACNSSKDIELCVSQLIGLSREGNSHESDQALAMKHAFNRLEELQSGDMPGLSTGFSKLDEHLGGFQKGDLIIIGGRSQHGKTALMMNLANHQNVPVGVISGEQPDEQLAMRSLSMTGNVSLQNMRTGKLDERDWTNISSAMQLLSDKKIFIFDKGGPSITEITAVARQWHHNKGIKILFVDFLQLVTGGEGDQHRLQIGDIARRLKVLAKQLNIPVVALAQVKRAVDEKPGGESSNGRMPYACDLSDSAMIEDASDQIITVYRPAVYWPNRPELTNKAYLNVCKNRHGPTGSILVEWIGEYLQFRDWSGYTNDY